MRVKHFLRGNWKARAGIIRTYVHLSTPFLMNLKLLIHLISLVLFVVACDEGDPTSPTTNCLPANVQNGLIAMYTFGNGSLNDGVAGSALTNWGGAVPTTDRDGNPSCAYAFNGQQRLTHLNPTFLNSLNAFSVSLWYHPIDTTREGGAFEVLLSRGDTLHCPDRYGGWSVALYDCRQAVFGHNNSAWASFSGLGFTCQEIINSQTDVWIHVVAVKNDNTYQIYYNGQLKDTETGDANCLMPYLAQDQGELNLGLFYKGKIDDVFVFNRAVSAAEVQALFTADACCE